MYAYIYIYIRLPYNKKHIYIYTYNYNYHKRSDESAPRLDDDDITVEVMVIHYLKDGKKDMTFCRLSSPFVSRAMFYQLLVYRNLIDRYTTYTLVKIQ